MLGRTVAPVRGGSAAREVAADVGGSLGTVCDGGAPLRVAGDGTVTACGVEKTAVCSTSRTPAQESTTPSDVATIQAAT